MKENEDVKDEIKEEVKEMPVASEMVAPKQKNDQNLDASVSLAIKKRQIPAIIGILGALVTVIACFLPLYTLSFLGLTKNVMYIEGDGVLVCACAVIVAVLIFVRKQRFSIIPVIGEVMFLCNTVFLAKDILDFGGSYGAGLIVLILGILTSFVGIVLAFIWKTDRSTKKGNIITAVVVALLAILLVVLMIVGQAYENAKKYNEAIEQMNKGNYDDAIDLFEKLEDYEDSQEKLTESKYLKAKSYLEDERYSDARDIFEDLGEYEDSDELVKICDFGEIKESYWDASDLPDIITKIKEKCPDLKEAKNFVNDAIREQLAYYDSYEDYDGALEFLNTFSTQWDVKRQKNMYKKKIADREAAEEEARREEEEQQQALLREQQELQEELYADSSQDFDYADLAGKYWGSGRAYASVSIYSSPEDNEIGNIEFALEDGTGYMGSLYIVEDGAVVLCSVSDTVYVRFSYDSATNMAIMNIEMNGESVATMNQVEHWYS